MDFSLNDDQIALHSALDKLAERYAHSPTEFREFSLVNPQADGRAGAERFFRCRRDSRAGPGIRRHDGEDPGPPALCRGNRALHAGATAPGGGLAPPPGGGGTRSARPLRGPGQNPDHSGWGSGGAGTGRAVQGGSRGLPVRLPHGQAETATPVRTPGCRGQRAQMAAYCSGGRGCRPCMPRKAPPV